MCRVRVSHLALLRRPSRHAGPARRGGAWPRMSSPTSFYGDSSFGCLPGLKDHAGVMAAASHVFLPVQPRGNAPRLGAEGVSPKAAVLAGSPLCARDASSFAALDGEEVVVLLVEGIGPTFDGHRMRPAKAAELLCRRVCCR